MPRIFSNHRAGTLSADPGSGGTTLNSAAFASLDVIASPNQMAVVLDPEGVNGAPEIVLVTTHTSLATSCTVTRAQEGTTARAHPIGTVWVVAATKADMDELPFRKLTTRGDLLVATAANVASRLAIGAANRVLRSDGTDPSWGQVQTADIADSAVTSAKIANGTIATADVADGAITAAKLASSIPLGEVAYAEVDANQGSITTEVDLTGLSVSFTAGTGRRYKITGSITATSTVASDVLYLKLTDTADTTLRLLPWIVPAASSFAQVPPLIHYIEPAAGTVNLKLRLVRVGGAGTLTMGAASTYPAFLSVEDVGEA